MEFKKQQSETSYIIWVTVNLANGFDRLCKIKMIGEIRQNFTETSASVGLILATALIYRVVSYSSSKGIHHRKLSRDCSVIFSLCGAKSLVSFKRMLHR